MDTRIEKVIKVEIIKEDTECFDIEVSETHNFFADDVLVHNCKICGLHKNEKCSHPDYVAPAPEAMGIDSYTMLSELEIPPKEDYHMLSMVYGNLEGDFKPTPLTPRPNNNGIIKDLNNVEAVYPVKEIWDPDQAKARCEKCKFYSQFLCDRKHFHDEDLYETIKDWHLYAIRLKNKINTQNAIKELHNYQLWTHRQGYWQSFQLLPVRCPICKDCSLENHMAGAYKKVQNRALPFCVSYFNLNPKVKGENIGYILA